MILLALLDLCINLTDDLYVDMHEYELLTKSLRPLPKITWLIDQETKYRRHYVDTILLDTRETFRVRSKDHGGDPSLLG